MRNQLFLILLFISYPIAQDFFPLSTGNYWDYYVESRMPGFDPLRTNVRLEIIGDTIINNFKTFLVNSSLGGTQGYYVVKDNDIDVPISLSNINEYCKIAQKQYIGNEEWSGMRGDFKVISSTYKLTTSKYVFTNCVVVMNVKTKDKWYYANGIGNVMMQSPDSSYQLITDYHISNSKIINQIKLVKTNSNSMIVFNDLLGRRIDYFKSVKASNFVIENRNNILIKNVFINK